MKNINPSEKNRKLRNFKLSTNKYASESIHVANAYGYVITFAQYYNVDDSSESSSQHGESRKGLISNNNFRKFFKNAIFTGGIRHNEKFGNRKSYTNFTKWNYKLYWYKIVYISNKPIYIFHNDWNNKTFIKSERGQYSKKYYVKPYENDDYNPKKQKNTISRMQNKILNEGNDIEKERDNIENKKIKLKR